MVAEYNGSAGYQAYNTATATNNPNNVTTLPPAPTVSSFTPATAGVGQTITITGTNFTGATAVSFGGTTATSYSVVNATTITAIVGSGSSGSVSVTTPSGAGTLAGFAFLTTWLGTVSSAWGTAGNWVPSGAPSSGSIYIASSAANPLALDANYSLTNISFGTGSPLIKLGNYTLTLSGTVSGYSSSSYIQTNGTGNLTINVPTATTVTLPVGRSAYDPLNITNNTSGADNFSVFVLDEVYANGSGGTVIPSPRVRRTWDISKASPISSGSINLNFTWNSGESTTITSPMLFHYTGGAWVMQTAGSTAAAANSLTYTGYTGTFSPFAVGDAAQPLPLTWLSFTATQQNSAVLLNWQTASESDTKDFIVQHSAEGINWLSIGNVHAAGNSTGVSSYRFTDIKPVAGYNFYRILQTGLDGSSSYSIVTKIWMASQPGKMIILGNPVTNGQLSLTLAGKQAVRLFTADGKQVGQYEFGAGLQQVDVSRFANGVYLLKSSTDIVRIVIAR